MIIYSLEYNWKNRSKTNIIIIFSHYIYQNNPFNLDTEDLILDAVLSIEYFFRLTYIARTNINNKEMVCGYLETKEKPISEIQQIKNLHNMLSPCLSTRTAQLPTGKNHPFNLTDSMIAKVKIYILLLSINENNQNNIISEIFNLQNDDDKYEFTYSQIVIWFTATEVSSVSSLVSVTVLMKEGIKLHNFVSTEDMKCLLMFWHYGEY
ncbi:hypothetical protein ACJX0J_024106 [Zea mays]